jgi:hypothetical protein
VTLIAQAYLHLKPLDESELTLEHALEVLDAVATRAALEVYDLVDLDLIVEEGSKKLWAGAIAIGAFLSHYGSIREGLDYLINDARRFGEVVTSSFVEEARIPSECVYRKERRLGVPGRLRRALNELNALSQQPDASSAQIRAVSEQIEGILRDVDEPADQLAVRQGLPAPDRPTPGRLPDPSRDALPAYVMEIVRERPRRLRRRKRVGRSPTDTLTIAESTDGTRMVLEVREDGELVELDDGSLWRVIPGGMTQTILWLPTQAVRVTRASSGLYRLRNQTTGDSVSAFREG